MDLKANSDAVFPIGIEARRAKLGKDLPDQPGGAALIDGLFGLIAGLTAASTHTS